MNKFKVGDKVVVTDGSSDGHTGVIVEVKKTAVRIKRDADKIEVDVSKFSVAVINKD